MHRILQLLSITCATLHVSPQSFASTRRVPADFAAISDAMSAAQDGDVILVDPGVYPEQVDFDGKHVVLRSTAGPEVTTLDGQSMHTVVRFTNGEGRNARLEGFTVRNGLGLVTPEAGGIWCKNSSPSIIDCIVRDNQGWTATPMGHAGAGGIGSDRGSPLIEDCVIESNRGGDGIDGAGGLRLERAGYLDHGFGIVVRNCVIRNNRGGDITTVGSSGAGGMRMAYGFAVIDGCTFEHNTGGDLPTDGISGDGAVGGLESDTALVYVSRCRIIGNQGGSDHSIDATEAGGPGGFSIRGTASVSGLPSYRSQMTNTIVAENRGGNGDDRGGSGGGFLRSCRIDITNCAIVGNLGGLGESVGGLGTHGLRLPNYESTLSNSILWLNEGVGMPDHVAAYHDLPPTPLNLLQAIDPHFVDLQAGDYHLACDSPAVNHGSNNAPAIPLRDFDQAPRVSDGQVDAGPFEFVRLGASYCQGAFNSSGQRARICSTGSLSIARNNLELVVRGLPGTPGLMTYGPNQVQVPFGDGFRCVGGTLHRLRPRPAGGSTIAIRLDLPSLQVTTGVQVNFQYWFRDVAAGGAGFNLSNGHALTLLP